MSDPDATERTDETAQTPPMNAARYPDGSVLYPPHPLGPGGEEPVELVDLSEYTAEIITWTSSTATPPGVRQPNHLAIVEFTLSDASADDAATPTASDDEREESVRAIGQLTTDDVAIGDRVEPVYAAALREPGAGIREPDSQSWDGYRFRPLE